MNQAVEKSSVKSKSSGLVESLIVMITICLIVVMLWPQFASASNDEKKRALEANLRTLRIQIQQYALYHNGMYPDSTDKRINITQQLTLKTNRNGDLQGGTIGPFLISIPPNPYTDNNTISNNDKIKSAWFYEVKNGNVIFKPNDGINESL